MQMHPGLMQSVQQDNYQLIIEHLLK